MYRYTEHNDKYYITVYEIFTHYNRICGHTNQFDPDNIT